MSWSKPGPGGPRGYHHGNLKEALIRAALELIAQKGSAGFTFAEAARWAGVSPAAPYRHFRDRDELLANVARRGFEAFEQTLARAWDNGRPDPMTARSTGSARPISPSPARNRPTIPPCSRAAYRLMRTPNCRPAASGPSAFCVARRKP